jgi:pimeloyl-ACP methyl ester carboxylesterase
VISRLQILVAAGDREGALRTFLGEQVGLPAPVLESMKGSPSWPAMLALAHTTPYDAALAAMTSLPSAQSLAGMKTRTLVLYGGASFPWMAATSRTLSQNLPNAELVLLEGQPHSPTPQALAPALLRFFLAE